MAFQINEKMLAPNRAMITVERNIKNVTQAIYRPGMMHFTSDDNELWCTTAPIKDTDYKNKAMRVITDRNFDEFFNSKSSGGVLIQEQPPLDAAENTMWLQII